MDLQFCESIVVVLSPETVFSAFISQHVITTPSLRYKVVPVVTGMRGVNALSIGLILKQAMMIDPQKALPIIHMLLNPSWHCCYMARGPTASFSLLFGRVISLKR